MPEVPAFWDEYRSPPTYRCERPVPTCDRPAPLEWTCGPFSMVRAMRKLERMLVDFELLDIALLCGRSSPGHVESRINEELARVPYSDDPDRWFQLNSLKNAARNIRKWGIEP